MKLHVSNLSYAMSDQELRELFAPHGTGVEATILQDRMTGHSRGFGTVTMATDEEAQRAREALHG